MSGVCDHTYRGTRNRKKWGNEAHTVYTCIERYGSLTKLHVFYLLFNISTHQASDPICVPMSTQMEENKIVSPKAHLCSLLSITLFIYYREQA